MIMDRNMRKVKLTVTGKEMHHSVKKTAFRRALCYIKKSARLTLSAVKPETQKKVKQREIIQELHLLYLVWNHMINVPCIFP